MRNIRTEEDPVLIDGDSLIFYACYTTEGVGVKLTEDEFFVCKDLARAEAVANKYNGELTGEVAMPLPLSYALHKAKRKVEAIKKGLGLEKFTLYLSGDQTNNPKKLIAPEYKANRVYARPVYYTKVRDYLLKKYEANVVETINEEADDAVVRDQFIKGGVIAAIDKDILYMVPGCHYNYSTKEMVVTSDKEAAYNLACYVLSGDKADNILALNRFGEIDPDDLSKGYTTKALDKVLVGMEPPLDEHYETLLNHYLTAAWAVYCEELKKLPASERKAKFMKVCQLLWLPIKGYFSILQVVNFNKIFGDE